MLISEPVGLGTRNQQQNHIIEAVNAVPYPSAILSGNESCLTGLHSVLRGLHAYVFWRLSRLLGKSCNTLGMDPLDCACGEMVG